MCLCYFKAENSYLGKNKVCIWGGGAAQLRKSKKEKKKTASQIPLLLKLNLLKTKPVKLNLGS